MRTRHWNSIMATTGKKLNLHADFLRLKHILGISPVKHRFEIEEVWTHGQKTFYSMLSGICAHCS